MKLSDATKYRESKIKIYRGDKVILTYILYISIIASSASKNGLFLN